MNEQKVRLAARRGMREGALVRERGGISDEDGPVGLSKASLTPLARRVPIRLRYDELVLGFLLAQPRDDFGFVGFFIISEALRELGIQGLPVDDCHGAEDLQRLRKAFGDRSYRGVVVDRVQGKRVC
jgi:hypothetical protein